MQTKEVSYRPFMKYDLMRYFCLIETRITKFKILQTTTRQVTNVNTKKK